MAASKSSGFSAWLRRVKADMRRDQRKAKVLIGLLPLLGVALIPLVLGGYPSKGLTQAAVAALDLTPEQPPVQVDQELAEDLTELMLRFEDTSRPDWSGEDADEAFGVRGPELTDPSARQGGPEGESSADLERELAERLRPSATFLSASQGDLAIIDGEPYREGDLVETFELLEIGERSVLLRGRFAEYPLRIPTRDGDDE